MSKKVGNDSGKVPTAQGGTENQTDRGATEPSTSAPPIYPGWIPPADADFTIVTADGYHFPVNRANLAQKSAALMAMLGAAKHHKKPKGPGGKK